MGRRRVIVLLFFLAAVCIQGCGGKGGGGNTGGTSTSGSSPQLAVTGLATAIQNGDISGALAYVSDVSQDKISKGLRMMDTSARIRLAAAILTAKKISENENRSVYKGTILLPGGQTVEETFEIVTDHGVWKFLSL